MADIFDDDFEEKVIEALKEIPVKEHEKEINKRKKRLLIANIPLM